MDALLSDPCSASADYGMTTRAVMVATVAGRDTGANVVGRMLNAIPGYKLGGFTAGNGWVQLAEFAQRWLTLREKMTNPGHSEYAHFSQFIATNDDGVAPEIPDSDFRAEGELLRRKVKPAWLQFFNLSKVMCGLRRLVVESNNPTPDRGFGFLHAFEDDGSENDSLDPPSRKEYSAERALRSLDLFLRLFPHGKIIVHLPVAALPSPRKPPPRCMCMGSGVACRPPQPGVVAWADDRRARMISQLLRYHRLRPDRTLLVAGSRDFRNISVLVHRVATFLGERPSQPLRRVAGKWFSWWATAMQSAGMLDVPHARAVAALATPTSSVGAHSSTPPSKRCQHAASRASARGQSKAAAARRGSSNATGAWDRHDNAYGVIAWCAPFRCNLTTADTTSSRAQRDFCVACPLGLAEWGWSKPARPSSAKPKADRRATL